MESDSQVQTTSVLDKQSSGIRALPSNDDDDDFDFDYDYNSDLSVEMNDYDYDYDELGTNFDGKNENNGVNGSSETSVSSGFNSNNGSYVSSDEKPSEGAKNDAPVSENVSGGESEASVVGVESPKPVAKVTEDDDENEVFSGEEDGGGGGVGVGGGGDGSVAVEEAPRVRVSAEESEDEVFEEAKEEPGDEEKREGETGEAKEGVGGGEGVGLKTEGTDGLGSSNGEGEGEGEGVESVEEDAVVDSINVDAGEVVRSGVAVVGVDEEKQDSQEVVETGDKAEKVEESSVIDEHSLEDSASAEGAGVKSTDEGHAFVESKQTDGGETDNSGAAGVGDAKEDSVWKVEVEPAEVNSSDEVKAAVEEDSVVDGVNVDVVKAVTSGVAVVGDSGGSEPEKEVKEEAGPVGENVTVANEFEPLARETSSEADDGAGKHNEEAFVDAEEINSKVDESKQQDSGDGVQTSSNEKGEDASEIFDVPQEEFDDGGSEGDGEFFKGEATSRDFAEEFASGDHSEMIDGQVVTDSEEEGDSDDEGDGRELIDSAALAALLKAATSAGASESGNITITSQDGSRLFSVERPAGLGTSLRSVRPPTNSSNSNIFAPPSAAAPTEESLSEEDKKKLQKIQDLRVKFLRLVQRLGQTADQSVAAQVLYKLAILSGRATFPSFSLDNAKQTAAQLEAEGNDDLDFSLNILVLGKTGVGKSATINSIFGEEKVKINAFEPETTSVNLVSGILDGVKLRVIDAPGLKTSASEQGFNRKVLAMVKKYTQKFPPDLMLYVDRLDSQTRDLNDIPILRTITSSLGNSIWRSAILTLTHAACAPPDGPSGAPLGYEVFVGQRSHIIQQSIGQAVGDLRFMNLSMMSPVSLVENHPACRKNREGQKVLPNGQAWRPQLLLLCYSLKILADASLTSKPQDPVDHRKLFGFRVRSPPLPYLLSSLLQPRTHPKLSADQGGDNGDSDIDLDDLSDTDQEEEDEYDQLPPFKPLRKTQIAKLSGEQRKAYFDEYDYRVKLLQKKQWREELKRMREMKKNGKSSLDDSSEMPEDYDGENGAPAAVPVPLPDMVLPPSFDSDSPAYRYRFLEPTSQFLARPVLDTHGWDHDCGYDGVNVEQNLGIAGRYPAAVTVQVTKDKKDFNIHLDSAVSAKHGDNGSSLVGFDIQTIGKQLAYIVRGESKFKTMKKNKTAGGVSVTFLGENVATGLKLEDQIALGKRLVLVGTAGTVLSQKDAAYGSNLEVHLKDADYPIGQDQSSFVLSLMKWRGDLAIGGNLQSQLSVGRSSKMAVRLALNNKQSGQITVKLNSSDHLALASVGVIPIFLAIYRKFKSSPSENYTLY